MVNIFLRIITIFGFLIQIIVWEIQAKKTNKAKPSKKHNLTLRELGGKYFLLGIDILIILQLFGLHIFSMQYSLLIQSIGFGIFLLGFIAIMISRKQIGDNWANGHAPEIRTNQQLITSGVYAYIRHPIYASGILMITGGELVAQSYLWISFLFLIVGVYFQSKREEKILLSHFGEGYQEYMKKTKMLIPFVL